MHFLLFLLFYTTGGPDFVHENADYKTAKLFN